jgi:hypothetical protein
MEGLDVIQFAVFTASFSTVLRSPLLCHQAGKQIMLQRLQLLVTQAVARKTKRIK